MQPLRLSISPCPNDVYIFSGIILGKVSEPELAFEVDYEDVETLNERVQHGEGDLVKISYANYLRCEAQYELLDCGGALGSGCGPLLLVHGDTPTEERPLLSPGEFTTANFLLDYYLGRSVPKEYLPFDALYARLLAEAGAQGVVIHEKRFTYQQDGLTLVADLGEYWEAQTGMPIPLGAIVVRRSLNLKERAESLIRESLRWAKANDAEAFALCRQYAQDLNPDVVRAHINLYVNHFSEDLGEAGHMGVNYFLAEQRKQWGLT